MIGVGTELKRLLQVLHIPPCDKCNGRAIIMDEEGPDWCRENLPTIVGWMKEEAKERQLPFTEVGAKFLVLSAIRLTKIKMRIMQR